MTRYLRYTKRGIQVCFDSNQEIPEGYELISEKSE